MVLVTVLPILLVSSFCLEQANGFLPNSHYKTRKTTTSTTTAIIGSCNNPQGGTVLLRVASDEALDVTDEEKQLDAIAHQLKLEIYDIDDGLYGYATRDSHYGLEVLHAAIVPTTGDEQGALGIELTEMASSTDGRGLVLISGISGAAADSELQVGDTLTGVRGGKFQECLTGLNYDLTVEAIAEAKAEARELGQPISFEVNRLIERARVSIEIIEGDGKVSTVKALAGENLRRLLQRKHIQVYNDRTKRFDMPFATGDCAGEGICGTCLVKVEQGMDMLSPKDPSEEVITEGRPLSWRASCRTVVGPDNVPGSLRIRTQPQTDFENEIDPGVRDISPHHHP